ncbi:MAG: PilZ domain-containing protein [Deltaproteobacteria bacterium]|nr:PilZ domain-containing protein [Deltaproteobacteria bacterium]
MEIEGMLKDRRRFLRYLIKSRCWCESKSVTMYVEILNIGQGGAFIKTYSPLSLGEMLKVRWRSMVSGREFIIPAEVIWRREYSSNTSLPPGMGIKFLKIFEELEKEIIIHQ